MKYDVIIFDADETLFDFNKSEKEAFRNAMLDLNLDYDENYHLKEYHEINRLIWNEFDHGLITQQELKVERFRRFLAKTNLTLNAEEFATQYQMHLSKASFLYDDSMELIKKLYPNYKLLIITNGLTVVQDNRIRQSTISKYFEDIIISEEVGYSKPNIEIFHYALNKINYSDKSKVLMVGDSLTSDIKGGINTGIDTCWLNKDKKPNTLNMTPTYEIVKLHDLISILNE
ncbi:YjjG family noncanonical pyrimidine nucleotidase [Anaeromicropila herbilytica]|uniref:Haloacid dehalogenase n=1 Tax=Anaeromicropila herbilytica TaxID=2785025 RepID=A0A7R7IBD1_9FIRM|nr:YjjG family noncanonical pyrimidine nucleotidase [Anaeromicropila herbilytica]BCN29467.1 haloacid dehalogenase [Anaeromicropila herbilytica]